MRSADKGHASVWRHSSRKEGTVQNRRQIVRRTVSVWLDIFVNQVNAGVDVDTTTTVQRTMPVSTIPVRIHVTLPMPVDQTLSVLHSSTDRGVSVQRTIWVIHTPSVILSRTIIVNWMQHVHLVRSVSRIGASQGAGMISIASLRKVASTNSVRIRALSTVLVDLMLSVNLSIMTDYAPVSPTSLVMPRSTVTGSVHLLNALSTCSVLLDPSVPMKPVSRGVDTRKTVLQNSPVSRTNVSMLVPFPVLVESEQPVLRPITLPSVIVHLDSVEIQMWNVEKSHQSAG